MYSIRLQWGTTTPKRVEGVRGDGSLMKNLSSAPYYYSSARRRGVLLVLLTGALSLKRPSGQSLSVLFGT